MCPSKAVFSSDRPLTPLEGPLTIRRWVIDGPWSIDEETECVEAVPAGTALVKVLRVGVCQGDLRYLAGRRPAEVLKERLPLAPFHEAVAQVVAPACDVTELIPGDLVVPVPALPCTIHDFSPSRPCTSCRPGQGAGENYCRDIRFLGSNVHGFGQTHLLMPVSRCLKIPEEVPWQIAFMTEPFSVAFQACRPWPLSEAGRVLILGAGVVGSMTVLAASLSRLLPASRLFVKDPDPERVRAVIRWASPWNQGAGEMDVVIECVGGSCAEETLRFGLDVLRPGGAYVLLGVPASDIPMPFRPLMDKGLTIRGTNRSTLPDYARALGEMRRPEVQKHLQSLITQTYQVSGPSQILEACRALESPDRRGKICLDLASPEKRQIGLTTDH